MLEQLHPGSSQRMANLSERTSQLRDTQQELIELALQPLRTCTGLDRRRLGALQPSTRRQLLAVWLQQQGVAALNAALLEQLTDRLALSAAGGGCDLPGGWRLQWQGDNLSLRPPAAGH